jgi:hypothetical protein
MKGVLIDLGLQPQVTPVFQGNVIAPWRLWDHLFPLFTPHPSDPPFLETFGISQLYERVNTN